MFHGALQHRNARVDILDLDGLRQMVSARYRLPGLVETGALASTMTFNQSGNRSADHLLTSHDALRVGRRR
jgi:hypothetical protein